MDKYNILEEIGEGGSGTIFKVSDKRSNTVFAMKRVGTYVGLDDFLAEVNIMKTVSHPNIVPIIDVFMDEYYGYYVMPLYDKSLYDHIKEVGKLDEDVVIKYSTQLLLAVGYLHKNNILHRDIKPGNILIKDNNIYLSDFGSAKFIIDKTKLSTCIQTQNYRAPEILMDKEDYDEKVDIWSIGCTIVEMINGASLFSEEDDMKLLIKIVKTFGSRHKIVHDIFPRRVQIPPTKALNIKDVVATSNNTLLLLCRDMLRVNPKMRISIPYSLQRIVGYHNYKRLSMHSIRQDRKIYKCIAGPSVPCTAWPSVPCTAWPSVPCTAWPSVELLEDSLITMTIRENILDWIVRVCKYFKLSDSICFNTISMIDKYTSINNIGEHEYQLLAICSLYISSCLYNDFGLEEGDCHEVTKRSYSYDELRGMIAKICQVLYYDVNIISTEYLRIPKSRLHNVIPIIKRIMVSFNLDWKNLNVICRKLSDIYNIPIMEIDINVLNKIYGKQRTLFNNIISKIDKLGDDYGPKEVVERWNIILSHIHNII
ncbi:serine-threonine kinase [Orpheovirus IHUMI-LCC2]|uniref:Serine/Threonine protein kinase n=1 Tax=Orpheovirus IHUMI-LCC2 TaxID=2023057 RepID=A0A2I2L395_9VIRU|nr:serine-threonine kinase [Orpheovirus IHUMI-LCC2]SNW61987.1 Serine/Threonine protein kinase [Orpheovirus IHUMI-LCC2]